MFKLKTVKNQKFSDKYSGTKFDKKSFPSTVCLFTNRLIIHFHSDASRNDWGIRLIIVPKLPLLLANRY